MEMKIQPVQAARRRSKPADEAKLIFGKTFSDHMFIMDYKNGRGWHEPRVVPYQNLSMDPSAMVLHYGQGIFEGLQGLPRHRRTYSALPTRKELRTVQPLGPPDVHAGSRHFFAVRRPRGAHPAGRELGPTRQRLLSFIRPTMIATEPALGVRPAVDYIYFIITGPVAAYYAEGFNPVKIYVSDEFVRAVRGGVGEAKTMANYAASLYAAEVAKKKGFTQVLWLDGVERRYIEEVGTMNIFFRIKDELVTPPLTGSILPGSPVIRSCSLPATGGFGSQSASSTSTRC